MYVTPRVEVLQYDGTNSAALLTILSGTSVLSGGTWSIEEEDEEGVVFKIFYEQYNEGILPKLTSGDYLVLTSRNGNVEAVVQDKLLDWFVVVAE